MMNRWTDDGKIMLLSHTLTMRGSDVASLVSLFVCLFVLRFYGPVNPMGSCRARSVYLTTHLHLVLLAVYQYCAHSFARN